MCTLLAHLTAEEVVEGRPDRGARRELAYLVEARGNGGLEHIPSELEFQAEGQEPAQPSSHPDKDLRVAVPQSLQNEPRERRHGAREDHQGAAGLDDADEDIEQIV